MESSVQQIRKGRTRVRPLTPEERRYQQERSNGELGEQISAVLSFPEEVWPTVVLKRFREGVLGESVCSFVKECYSGAIRRSDRKSNPIVMHAISEFVPLQALEPVIAFCREAFRRDVIEGSNAVQECVRAVRLCADTELRRRSRTF